MDFRKISEANLRRCEASNGFNHRLRDWSQSDWFVAAAGELGEACNVVKKLNRYRDGIYASTNFKSMALSERELLDKLRQEVGDTVLYLDLIAHYNGFTLEAAAIEVFDAKSRELGYPVILAQL